VLRCYPLVLDVGYVTLWWRHVVVRADVTLLLLITRTYVVYSYWYVLLIGDYWTLVVDPVGNTLLIVLRLPCWICCWCIADRLVWVLSCAVIAVYITVVYQWYLTRLRCWVGRGVDVTFPDCWCLLMPPYCTIVRWLLLGHCYCVFINMGYERNGGRRSSACLLPHLPILVVGSMATIAISYQEGGVGTVVCLSAWNVLVCCKSLNHSLPDNTMPDIPMPWHSFFTGSVQDAWRKKKKKQNFWCEGYPTAWPTTCSSHLIRLHYYLQRRKRRKRYLYPFNIAPHTSMQFYITLPLFPVTTAPCSCSSTPSIYLRVWCMCCDSILPCGS